LINGSGLCGFRGKRFRQQRLLEVVARVFVEMCDRAEKKRMHEGPSDQDEALLYVWYCPIP